MEQGSNLEPKASEEFTQPTQAGRWDVADFMLQTV